MIFALVKRMSASSTKRIRKLARKRRAPGGSRGSSPAARRRARSAVATAQHRPRARVLAAVLPAPAVELLRLAEGLRGRRLGRRVVLLEPARRLVVRLEADLAFALRHPLRALARERRLPAHGSRVATSRAGPGRPARARVPGGP